MPVLPWSPLCVAPVQMCMSTNTLGMSPSPDALRQRHPLTRTAWWLEILESVQSPVVDSDTLDQRRGDVTKAWPLYLQLMSWWRLQRFHRRSGNSLTCRPRADVVVLHPVGRFTTAKTTAQWRDACYWTMLAHCNHGIQCASTFRDAQQLDDMDDEALAQLTKAFTMASSQERH